MRRALDDDRQPAPIEVERNLVALDVPIQFASLGLQDRGVKRTADSGLELAVELRKHQWAFRSLSERIDRGVQRHHSRRQRSRLVAAENVDAAEILNRRKMLHDDLLARHAHRSPARA